MVIHQLFNLQSCAYILIGLYFVFFGIWNIYHWNRLIVGMLERNISHAYFLLPIGIGWQTIAGGMILFDTLPKIAALSLIPFTIFAVFLFHPFWKHRGEHRLLDLTIFITNLTVVLGALLLIIAPINNWHDFLT